MCVCIKQQPDLMDFTEEFAPEMLMNYDEATGFANICGECNDPCALEFVPKHLDKIMERLGESS